MKRVWSIKTTAVAAMLTLAAWPVAIGMTGSAAAASPATVFTDQTNFTTTTQATEVAWPSESDVSTLLPYHPWAYNDYSCAQPTITLGSAGETITVTNPGGSYICFLGTGWNAPSGNIVPQPTGPTIVNNGEDDYQVVLTFSQPQYAVGFGLLTNFAANETVTLHYADSTTEVISDSSLGTAANSFEFVGFKNAWNPITSVELDTTGGASQNEGITGIWTAGDIAPTGEILQPVADSVHTPGQPLALDAKYYDDNPGTAVFWAVRVDANVSCTNTGSNQYWGNVDGDSDPFVWAAITGGMEFTSTADTTGWPTGKYCFVFNPGAGDTVPTNETNIRLISEFYIDTPPVADPGGPYLVPVGSSVTFDGSGSYDPDSDPISYAWTAGGGGLDDSTLASPTYTALTTPGIYNVSLEVTDQPAGLTDTATTTVVVYDPSAGFVTGGGWIDSPAGAYAADETLTGKATFGFVSKYQKGASVPTGNTQFVFHAGDLNFSSTSYQWLVVNQGGTNAQFKGTGTINGAGTYDFMIWAGDSSPDTFRIQITDGSGATVYDNGAQQALGGGSIIVHTGK